MDMFSRIRKYLHDKGVEFRALHHIPTLTSEASADARGEDLAIGGKALVIKVDDEYKLFVLSAARKIDSKKVKDHFKAKKIRFASRDELSNLTGLVPGSIPPFGKPILEFDLFVDTSVPQNARIAFNAGSLTDSIIMATDDYLRIADPVVFNFSQL